MHLRVGSGGWVRVKDPESGLIAFVRFDRDPKDGRLVPGALVADAHEEGDDGLLRRRPIRGADLRRFPLAAAETAVNGELREEVLAKFDRKQKVVFQRDDRQSAASPVDDRDKDADVGHQRRPPAQLDVPTTRPFPDEFYHQVAKAYADIASWSNRPASEIAEASGANISSVRRWILQARKRGYLPPGRPGKVG